MTGTYCLGAFNDNFFKQGAFLSAVSLRMESMQGYVALAMTLPYILLAAPAGWLADRFAKRHVVIAAKALELVAMLLGAAGLIWNHWPLVLTMAFIMGLQSCVFSPALNGALPELFSGPEVTRANAVVKAAVTVAILAGLVLAGVVRDLGGEPALGLAVIVVAVIGVTVSFAVPHRPPADPDARFPWLWIVETGRRLASIRRDRPLARIVIVSAFIWSLGILQLLLINPMSKTQFGWGDTETSGLLGAELIGIAMGGAIAGRVADGPTWQRVLAPSLAVLAALLATVTAVPWLGSPGLQYATLAVLLFGGGIAGGLVLVPCEAYIQVRPGARSKGAVIAAANFVVFCGIAAASGVANMLNLWIEPTDAFGVVAVGTGAFAYYVYRMLSERREA
jgi:MFS family permease